MAWMLLRAPVVATGGDFMASYSVGYFVGSLAKASINRKLALALVRVAPQELQFSEIPFRDLPLYSYDVITRVYTALPRNA
jgi:NAD(P)H-dependent FMN reductase